MMKMKRCLIVTGGTIDIAFAKDFLSQRSYDYVIAADAGLEVLRPLHISPNAVVGDLDTVDKKVLEDIRTSRTSNLRSINRRRMRRIRSWRF